MGEIIFSSPKKKEEEMKKKSKFIRYIADEQELKKLGISDKRGNIIVYKDVKGGGFIRVLPLKNGLWEIRYYNI